MPVRMPVSDRHSDRPPDRPFSLGPPSPGARPRGLGDHPPALPSPLRGRSRRRARASSPPTLPSHHRGGAGVRRLLYAFPPSPPLCAGLSQDMAARRGRKKKGRPRRRLSRGTRTLRFRVLSTTILSRAVRGTFFAHSGAVPVLPPPHSVLVFWLKRRLSPLGHSTLFSPSWARALRRHYGRPFSPCPRPALGREAVRCPARGVNRCAPGQLLAGRPGARGDRRCVCRCRRR